MLDVSELASEAELLAEQLRGARCCDALDPCYRCSLLKFNVLARRRVVEVPGTEATPSSSPTDLFVVRETELDLQAS